MHKTLKRKSYNLQVSEEICSLNWYSYPVKFLEIQFNYSFSILFHFFTQIIEYSLLFIYQWAIKVEAISTNY